MGAPLLALRSGATTRKQICLKGQKEKVLSLLPSLPPSFQPLLGSQVGHFPPPRALHSCTTCARVMMTENGHNEEEEEEEALDSVTRKVASRTGEKLRQGLAEVKVQSTNWGIFGEGEEGE